MCINHRRKLFGWKYQNLWFYNAMSNTDIYKKDFCVGRISSNKRDKDEVSDIPRKKTRDRDY